MRITSKMMTNNMLSNINKNKFNMTNLEQQYSTGKKIQRPSDDPIITVRALRFRTNLTELEQYYEKNIPDAESWLGITESALMNVNDLLHDIKDCCTTGSTDTLNVNNREAIVRNLEELRDQIYQEGNTNLAGRYVFTGYKTDTPLVFDKDVDNLKYDITEVFSNEQIQIDKKVIGSYEIKDYEDPLVTFDQSPQYKDIYRLQLSYEKVDNNPIDSITYKVLDTEGNLEEHEITNIFSMSTQDGTAYSPEPGAAHFIYETGEIVFGEDLYDDLRTAQTIQTTYSKTEFDKGDLRPEHYYDCIMTDMDDDVPNPVTYTKDKQQINYEINYNQELTINTEASDAILHTIGRAIDDIFNSVDEMKTSENKINHVKKQLKDTSLTDSERLRYERMLEQFEIEYTLKEELMQNTFEKGITISEKEKDRVNVAVTDLGSRHARLRLTENRMSSQMVDFKELLSKNEDANLSDTIINYNSALTIYNASLSAASKIVQNTLLNFL